MAMRLPAKKLSKARLMVKDALTKTSLSLQELQLLTGYLNFAAIVVPLGRTFLRRLYNMQMYFPKRGHPLQKRISREAKKDLQWWENVLNLVPERSIDYEHKKSVFLWSDASGTKGLGP
ncbi:hypothetical protein HOY80DRAFT_997881 [Tuber brumale]|nr:hypothetical protein HOY80DRAFT_997881 [Tuber brumale]